MLIKSKILYFNDSWISSILLIYYSVDSNRYFGGYYWGFQGNIQPNEQFFFFFLLPTDLISLKLAWSKQEDKHVHLYTSNSNKSPYNNSQFYHLNIEDVLNRTPWKSFHESMKAMTFKRKDVLVYSEDKYLSRTLYDLLTERHLHIF